MAKLFGKWPNKYWWLEASMKFPGLVGPHHCQTQVLSRVHFKILSTWLIYGPPLSPHRPHDVLATLLNNLKVQERQNRVCTTVAIAIVAETCSPFTVLPALMNEYRVPELNVQNGVLKSLSFLFEYIGEMGKDYIYAVTPLLEDALMDRWVDQWNNHHY